MTKNAFLTSSDIGYLPYLNVFLNSLEYVGNTQDVHILSWDLPKDYLDKLSQLSFKTIVQEVSDNPKMQELGQANTLLRYRFEVASQLTDYDCVAVFDADSIVVRDLSLWFEIAARAKVIIGISLEQKKWYGREEKNKVDGKQVIPKVWNENDLAASPLFFSPKDFGDAFSYSYHIFADYSPEKRFKANDMDAFNLGILKKGYQDRILGLPEATWSGLHETLLKPFSHICEMHDKFWTNSGEAIFVLHGQFANKGWQEGQIASQDTCVDRELDGSPCCKRMARECLETIISYFKEMSEYKIRI